jgi:opacity protein-like surface antigen
MTGRHLCALGAALACATAVQAQGFDELSDPDTRSIRYGVGAGAARPLTEARFQQIQTGAAGQAFLLLRVANGLPVIRIGADFSRVQFGPHAAGATGSVFGKSRTQVGGVLSLRFDLSHGAVRPYLVGGVGAFSIRDALDITGSLSNGNSISTTQIGLDGGGGVSIRLGAVRAFLEARVQNLYTKPGFLDTGSTRMLPITAGLIF